MNRTNLLDPTMEELKKALNDACEIIAFQYDLLYEHSVPASDASKAFIEPRLKTVLEVFPRARLKKWQAN